MSPADTESEGDGQWADLDGPRARDVCALSWDSAEKSFRRARQRRTARTNAVDSEDTLTLYDDYRSTQWLTSDTVADLEVAR